MVFSSPIFVFVFLPLVLLVYYLAAQRIQNIILLVFSLLFYAWGEGERLTIMLVSIIINYFTAILINKQTIPGKKKFFLFTGILLNLSLLLYYKYTNFFVANFNILAEHQGWKSIMMDRVILPLGISFFTFQGMSYIVDVYRKQAEVQRNPFNLALYISFFPQLIAGPIVRYHDISMQLTSRKVTLELFVSGIQRFIIGLSKKVLIADSIGRVSNELFTSTPEGLPAYFAWLGMITAVVQIYYDFSGYSDMAIGMGRMFGFQFLENFKHPLSVKNMRLFWTHWHISLSNWFRDYIYIPLGGNKKGVIRTQFNLWLIFFLSGLWHGSEWTFVIFGIYHGVFMVAERLGTERLLNKLPVVLQNMYVWLIFCLSIILFCSPDVNFAWNYFTQLFDFNSKAPFHQVWLYLQPEFFVLLAVGIVFCYPLKDSLIQWTYNHFTNKQIPRYIELTGYFILLIFSMAAMAGSTYSPFIYFRF